MVAPPLFKWHRREGCGNSFEWNTYSLPSLCAEGAGLSFLEVPLYPPSCSRHFTRGHISPSQHPGEEAVSGQEWSIFKMKKLRQIDFPKIHS